MVRLLILTVQGVLDIKHTSGGWDLSLAFGQNRFLVKTMKALF